jgi:sec-independent protein translocase protein TatB
MDSFFGIGVFELVFIIIFALIFLGPERLPGVLRQIIGVIRQVRDLTSDVTRQFNDEFGDLTDLDPRRQIQKALNETTSDIKDATKPVNKALNKPAAKTTPNTAAKPTTTPKPTPKPTVAKPTVAKPTVAKSTTDVAAAAESSVDTAEVTAAAAAKAASAAQNTGEVSDTASNVTADAVQETDSATVNKVESSNDDFTENKIAPPNTARQTPPKDVSVSGSKPTGEPPAETPVDEATAEEKSL